MAVTFADHSLDSSETTPSLLVTSISGNSESTHAHGYMEFYEKHQWCLNPFQTILEIRAHVKDICELLDQSVVPWQQEECRINIYLLLCALSCSAGDFLSQRYWPTPAGPQNRAGLRGWIRAGKWLANCAESVLRRTSHSSVHRWKVSLDRTLDTICHWILLSANGEDAIWSLDATDLAVVLTAPLPDRLLKWQARIPEAFRCQDMTHHDVITMARNYLDSLSPSPRASVFVLGPRTAGAYFVPLISASLERSGINVIGKASIRPKEGLSRLEQRLIRSACVCGAQIVVVDDHPNTGNTFRLLVGLLRSLGARDQNIVLLAPDHAAQTDWIPQLHPVRVVTLRPAQFFKARLLKDDARLLSCLQDCRDAEIEMASDSADDLCQINQELESHFGDSFQVRLKRVFEIKELRGTSRSSSVPRRILVKSVGWGWLGYHAVLAADRLAGFTPQLFGYGNGLLFIEWVGQTGETARGVSREQIAEVVPSYLANRLRSLPLPRDPTVGALGLGVTGRDRILNTLRRPYGPLLMHIARMTLGKGDRILVTDRPCLVDGRMTSDNWILGKSGLQKIDFEQHNFGGAEENFVDPAHDLAAAIFALELDQDQQERLVSRYAALSGDEDVKDRLMLHKLRIGMREMDRAADTLGEPFSAERHRGANRRFLAGRDFLTYQVNLHHSSRIDVPTNPTWSKRIVFLDLDGVFDVQRLGYFPHTTPNGLIALCLLQDHGYSVVPNTGRSVEHVRNYCQTFGLPGGIAEYGSVFVDCVSGKETNLFGEQARVEIERCRSLLEQMPGVHCDPHYGAALRAYRYRGARWVGLQQDEIDQILERGEFEQLQVIRSSSDSYFVPAGVSKGSAVAAVRRYLGVSDLWTAAIGDSAQDISMLGQVDAGFVVKNASNDVKSFARGADHVRVLSRTFQSGLLDAVDHILKDHGHAGTTRSGATSRPPLRVSNQSLDAALALIDRSALRRLLAALGFQSQVHVGIPPTSATS